MFVQMRLLQCLQRRCCTHCDRHIVIITIWKRQCMPASWQLAAGLFRRLVGLFLQCHHGMLSILAVCCCAHCSSVQSARSGYLNLVMLYTVEIASLLSLDLCSCDLSCYCLIWKDARPGLCSERGVCVGLLAAPVWLCDVAQKWRCLLLPQQLCCRLVAGMQNATFLLACCCGSCLTVCGFRLFVYCGSQISTRGTSCMAHAAAIVHDVCLWQSLQAYSCTPVFRSIVTARCLLVAFCHVAV
jgi:hypothetical protein